MIAMFGNHLLPNIAHHFSCYNHHHHTHSRRRRPPLWLPTWAKRGCVHCWHRCPPTTPCHRRLPPPRHHPLMLPASAMSPPPPLPSLRDVGGWHLPHHGCRQPPRMPTPCHITEKNTRPRMPRHEARGGGRVNGSEEEGEQRRERGIKEEREAAGAQGGGWGAALAAPVSCRFKWGQHVLPPFLFVSNGAVCAAPFLCLLNGGSVCCPCFSSFWTGQHLLPCFFSFQTGAVCAAPVSLHFERGSTCCPISFHFERGSTYCPISFPLPPNNGGYLIFSVLINVQ